MNGFVRLMEEKSLHIRLTDSIWGNPSGMLRGEKCSLSTARDLARLVSFSVNYPLLLDMFKNKMYQFGDIQFKSTFAFDKVPMDANIIIAKTGSWFGIESLAFVAKVNGSLYGCSLMNTLSPPHTSRRFVAMREVINVLLKYANGDTLVGVDVPLAMNVCIYEIDKNDCNEYYASKSVYEKNADCKGLPMSVTKLLTLMIAIDKGVDMQEQTYIRLSDLYLTEGTSGTYFHVGMKVRIEDLFYAALLPSSNQAANAIARVCGRHEY